VECTSSLKSIKYIYKYVYKGHDRTTMKFGEAQDEVKLYLDAHYVGAPEAGWRIYQFGMHSEFPAVQRLQVHEENMQIVTWDDTAVPDMTAVVERAAQKDSTLTAYFKANGKYETARDCLYQEFPQKFVWKTKAREWTPRKRGYSIGRMYYAHPTCGERFYLRTLLTCIKGAISFEDLRTVDGVVQPSFREACLKRGLLQDDGEWDQCLSDAVHMQTGYQLRDLFVTILRECAPLRPEQLWENFREHICDDLKHKLRAKGIPDPTEDQIYDYGLHLIEMALQRSGSSLTKYEGMQTSQMDWGTLLGNHYIAEQRGYDPVEQYELAQARIELFNEGQRNAFDQIMDSVDHNLGKIFFLDGPGGTGKTFVYNTICAKIRSQGKIILCVASSGIAAVLLSGGRTAHSRFKIPLNISESSTCNISMNSLQADLLRITNCVIWDEAIMQHRHIFDAVNKLFQDVNKSKEPFGGVTVVFGGDFQQILPVIMKGSRAEIVAACLCRSPLWNIITVLKLTENKRLGNDIREREFAQWQLEVGHGQHTDAEGNIRLPDHFKCSENTVESLIKTIYPNISEPHADEYFKERTILSARNNDVDAMNHDILNEFPGEELIFQSSDSVKNDGLGPGEEFMYPVEYLNSINASGLPLSKLRLKIGAPVMILRNMDPESGVCNGTRGILTRASQRVLEICLLTGDSAGQTVFLPRINTSPADELLPFKLFRRQFPARLAFSMTINKSQGQSLKDVGISFLSPVFTHGQFYVAISRVTSVNNIKAIWPPNSPEPITKNVVYPEVLIT
jgi:hypothetical protein